MRHCQVCGSQNHNLLNEISARRALHLCDKKRKKEKSINIDHLHVHVGHFVLVN